MPTQVAGIKHAVSPYCYRCPLGKTYPSCEVACAKDIEELIRTTTQGLISLVTLGLIISRAVNILS